MTERWKTGSLMHVTVDGEQVTAEEIVSSDGRLLCIVYDVEGDTIDRIVSDHGAALAAQETIGRLRAALRGLSGGSSSEPDWLRCWCPESWTGGRSHAPAHAPECEDARAALSAAQLPAAPATTRDGA